MFCSHREASILTGHREGLYVYESKLQLFQAFFGQFFFQNSSKISLKLKQNLSETQFSGKFCSHLLLLLIFSKIQPKISKFIENSTKSFKNSRISGVKTQEICQNSIFRNTIALRCRKNCQKKA